LFEIASLAHCTRDLHCPCVTTLLTMDRNQSTCQGVHVHIFLGMFQVLKPSVALGQVIALVNVGSEILPRGSFSLRRSLHPYLKQAEK